MCEIFEDLEANPPKKLPTRCCALVITAWLCRLARCAACGHGGMGAWGHGGKGAWAARFSR